MGLKRRETVLFLYTIAFSNQLNAFSTKGPKCVQSLVYLLCLTYVTRPGTPFTRAESPWSIAKKLNC